MKLTLLPSEKGDCILIEGGAVSILADGGMPASYVKHVRSFIGNWAAAGKQLDLVYVSHVDQDHIGGILRLMEDLVEWRVHKFKLANGRASREPSFPEPPRIKRIWHNSFKALVPENSGPIETMLASRANALASMAKPAALKLAAAYRNIAASIPEAIKVSRRIATDQLDIPLNKEFGGKLAMVRDTDEIKLKRNSRLSIKILGPFQKDLEILRDFWNAWLLDAENRKTVQSLEEWLDDKGGPIGSAAALTIDDEIGRRNRVTEPNLASLMLLLEESSRGRIKRAVLTGDGHHEDVLAGLEHHGLLTDGGGLHVDIMKMPHHGSEHNMDRSFAKRLTADHYVFCANGEHENPDVRILEVLLASRLGTGTELSSNAEAGQPFTIWLNCSTAFMDREIAAKIAERKKTTELQKARKHLAEVEAMLDKAKRNSNGRLTVNLLDTNPLELEI
jgi:hypothetical protein